MGFSYLNFTVSKITYFHLANGLPILNRKHYKKLRGTSNEPER